MRKSPSDDELEFQRMNDRLDSMDDDGESDFDNTNDWATWEANREDRFDDA